MCRYVGIVLYGLMCVYFVSVSLWEFCYECIVFVCIVLPVL